MMHLRLNAWWRQLLCVTVFVGALAPLAATATFSSFPASPTPTPAATATATPGSGNGGGGGGAACCGPSPSIPAVQATGSPGPSVGVTPATSVGPPTTPSATTSSVTPNISSAPVVIPQTSPGTSPGASGSTTSLGSFFSGGSVNQVISDVSNILPPILSAILALPALVGIILIALNGAEPLNIIGAFSESLWTVFGIRRRARVWGTVYDSVTKRGVPYVKVELLDQNNRVLEARYTDRSGRYGFLIDAKALTQHKTTIQIRPSVKGYSFPSTKVTSGVTDYIVYEHVYTGGPMPVRGDDLLNFNVPMDPVGGVSHSFSEFLPWRAVNVAAAGILGIGFWFGLILLPLATLYQPSRWNFFWLGLFIVANGVRSLLGLWRRWGVIRDHANDRSVPFALITLNRLNGVRADFTVSDEQGRYVLVTNPGTWLLTAHTPANIQPTRQQSVAVTTKRGWITRTVTL